MDLNLQINYKEIKMKKVKNKKTYLPVTSAALTVNKKGDFTIYIPNMKGDEDVPYNIKLLAAFFLKTKDVKFCKKIVSNFEKEAKSYETNRN